MWNSTMPKAIFFSPVRVWISWSFIGFFFLSQFASLSFSSHPLSPLPSTHTFPAPTCHWVPEVNTIYFRIEGFVPIKTSGFHGVLASSCHVTNQPQMEGFLKHFDYLSWVCGLTEFKWKVLTWGVLGSSLLEARYRVIWGLEEMGCPWWCPHTAGSWCWLSTGSTSQDYWWVQGTQSPHVGDSLSCNIVCGFQKEASQRPAFQVT